MAAHLIRLKVTLLRNQLASSGGQTMGLLLSAGLGLLLTAGLVAGLVYLRTQPLEEAAVWLTVSGSVLVLGWVVAPLGNVGGDQTLDPTRFVTYAVPRRQLITGLLAGSAISVPAVVTAVVSLGTVVVWSRDALSAVVAVVAGLLGLATCLVASRAAGTGMAVLQGARKVREIVMSLGVMVVLVLSLMPLLVTQGVVQLNAVTMRPVADLLAPTPLGWLWSAPWDAADGAIGLAVLKLALGAALVPLLMWAWGVLLERHLVRPPSSGGAIVRGGGGIFAAVPGATGAVAQRCLSYWRRDPRYTLSVVMVFALPVLGLLLVAIGWVSLQTWALGVAPLMAFFVGFGLHNDIAYDADPWWLHLAAGVPGRADRAGRVLASVVWGLPLVLVAAVGGSLLAGRLDVLPAVLGLAAAVLGAGYGVSSVAAVIAPYWAPAPGENPNATPPGVGGQMFVSQVVASAATLVAAAPLVVPFILALGGSAAAAWIALILGVALGGALTVAGVVVGGRILDRRGPDLLATVRK